MKYIAFIDVANVEKNYRLTSKIRVKHPTTNEHRTRIEWCDNLAVDCYYWYNPEGTLYFFENKDCALMFKMQFGFNKQDWT